MTGLFTDADIIHRHTRAQLLDDGDLVDVSPLATEAGFKYPVALSRAAWTEAVEWNDSNAATQDETGRLWDVLMVARYTAKVAPLSAQRMDFHVLRVPNTPQAHVPRRCDLYAHCGPGDTPAPVITILRPGED